MLRTPVNVRYPIPSQVQPQLGHLILHTPRWTECLLKPTVRCHRQIRNLKHQRNCLLPLATGEIHHGIRRTHHRHDYPAERRSRDRQYPILTPPHIYPQPPRLLLTGTTNQLCQHIPDVPLIYLILIRLRRVNHHVLENFMRKIEPVHRLLRQPQWVIYVLVRPIIRNQRLRKPVPHLK